MQRHTVTPRPNWQDSLERLGFGYHSIDGNYWQENAYYAFTDSQIDTLETATNELHALYEQALLYLVKTGDYGRIGLNDRQAELVAQSVQERVRVGEMAIYGRFDLSYDGIGEPKLLEYNADTPTALFEASVAQWYWLKDRPAFAHFDQFNSIHERLVIAWQALKRTLPDETLYFTAYQALEEDFVTCRYLQDTAMQAGFATQFLDLGDIGYELDKGVFVDLANRPIRHIFKLYPWEWLSEETFGNYIKTAGAYWIEPAYKLVFANKALLAILWELFPNHPNLLPCYFELGKLKHHSPNYVKKPLFSREGANIELFDGNYQKTMGDYGAEGYVYQALKPLPKFINNSGQMVYAVIGSWVVGGVACGIGIREDGSLITKDTSLFVPHLFY